MYWLATNVETKLLNFMDSGYLYQKGWFRSIGENRSVNLKGEEIAWLPYSLLNFLDDRLDKKMKVLEFGAGASTRYFARRVNTVVSIEGDRSWYDAVLADKPDNVHLILAETQTAYTNVPDKGFAFDLILVDGEFREECLLKSVGLLSDRGVILLDDTNAPELGALIDKMTSLGFKHLKFNDFAPIIAYNKESTLFYRSQNCMAI
jgi:hypothetical protein